MKSQVKQEKTTVAISGLSGPVVETTPLLPADYIAPTCLALLGELEISLRSGQQALLASDLFGIERSTAEQVRLHRTLAAVVCGAQERLFRECTPERTEQARQAALHILQIAGVQTALLQRKQEFLTVLGNCLAGQQAFYDPTGAVGGDVQEQVRCQG